MEMSGAGRQDGDYARDVMKVLHGLDGVFLLNIALQRIPETELLPSERMKEILAVGKPWEGELRKCRSKYGGPREQWPSNGCPELRMLESELGTLNRKYREIVRQRVIFDKPLLLKEESWQLPTFVKA
jgi:hypothetical protein